MELITLKAVISGSEIFSQPTAPWNKENCFQTVQKIRKAHYLLISEPLPVSPFCPYCHLWTKLESGAKISQTLAPDVPWFRADQSMDQHQSIFLSFNHKAVYYSSDFWNRQNQSGLTGYQLSLTGYQLSFSPKVIVYFIYNLVSKQERVSFPGMYVNEF